MSNLDAIKFLLDGSYRGAESKFKNQIKSLKQENETLKNRVADLEAKLADKEKEITDFELEVGDLRLQNRNLKEQFKYAVQSKNQDKISFAIDKLTEVKKLIENKLVEFDNIETKMIIGLFAFNITCQIDNQIKQLKEKDNG